MLDSHVSFQSSLLNQCFDLPKTQTWLPLCFFFTGSCNGGRDCTSTIYVHMLDMEFLCSNLPAAILRSFPYQKGFPFVDPFLHPLQMSEKTKANLISVEGNFLYTWKDQKTIVFRCFQRVKKDNVNKKWIKLYFLCGNICSEFIHMVVKEINNLTFL